MGWVARNVWRAVRGRIVHGRVDRARVDRARVARAPLVKFVKRKIFLNLYCKMKVFNVYLFLARSS